VLCRDQNIPIRVFDITRPGSLIDVIEGREIGTVVDRGQP
jgi:uridylate kinase